MNMQLGNSGLPSVDHMSCPDNWEGWRLISSLAINNISSIFKYYSSSIFTPTLTIYFIKKIKVIKKIKYNMIYYIM
jgi:hypothetical protein